MNATTCDMAATYFHRYALLDIERRDREGEFGMREEAAQALQARRSRGSLDRALAGTGDFLIWLGQKLKNRNRVESPAAV